jgi:hypothetical protein
VIPEPPRGTPDPEPAPPPEEAVYFRRIEERFSQLRGAPILVSPRDWALIAEWWSRSVPLGLVLDALEEVFAARVRRGAAGGPIHSLRYARHEVERRFALHREISSPRRDRPAETERLRMAIRRHLLRLTRALREASAATRGKGHAELAGLLLAVAGEVRILRREADREDWDPPAAEQALERMDAEILDAIRSSLAGGDLRRLEREARSLLEPQRGRMTEAAYRESLRALEARILRREFSLPRLALLGEG